MLVEATGCDFIWIAGQSDDGWCAAWGNREIYEYFLPRVRAGQRVLDLGCGWGRNTHRLYFAGLGVVGVDNSSMVIERNMELRRETGVEHPVLEVDAWNFLADYGKDFDYVFAIDVLLHLGKRMAISRLEDTVMAMKSGALLYVNVPSTESNEYKDIMFDTPEIERDTFEMECSCSGVAKLEPICFFWPGELELHLARLGTRIKLSRLVRDWQNAPPKSSVITQKI